ncbi:MAG: DUF2249 domain-containing protein [Nitrospinae bacterium]|nr:DUF2249 domain-containing protein [Nitrospinota bacterium]
MSKENIVKLDIRVIPPSARHPGIVFNMWDKLKVGETLQIINDHDPKPLHQMFESEHSGSYTWEYVSNGAQDWVINITKTK